ncbi:hypothetical protein PF004_g6802 [Phytophthora fragariae]|uniref:Uncharacterized protein n=1 Tax=Phytophthora fragariae TaxID=53985 RepID=A0A6G0PBV9_9STRA|nr:hypothetical protein PF004_g6802 [Phytophthora fragariae]
MTCTTKKTKGKWLTIAQKWQVIEEHGRSQPSPSLADLDILRSATTVMSKLEAACTPKGRSLTLRCPELEERLASYVEACVGIRIGDLVNVKLGKELRNREIRSLYGNG